jgi:hypothetical protein
MAKSSSIFSRQMTGGSNGAAAIRQVRIDTLRPSWRAMPPLMSLAMGPRAGPRTVCAFVSEFRGLSGSGKQKAVVEESGLARLPLSAMFDDGAVDPRRIAALLGSDETAYSPREAAGSLRHRQLSSAASPRVGGDPCCHTRTRW